MRYFSVIADLMELAVHGSIGGLCAHHSQGDADVQDSLYRSSVLLLKEFGVKNPRKATGRELLDCAAWIRTNRPENKHTSRERLAQILSSAALRIRNSGDQYGPARHRPGNDIVDAVAESCTTLEERYDTLTVIVQSVPSQTITHWEWNLNTEGPSGAVRLLLGLADNVPFQRRTGNMHQDAPPPVVLKMDLGTPAITDTAREAGGGPEPLRTQEEKRQLIRSFQEESAASSDDWLAGYFQKKADGLRRD